MEVPANECLLQDRYVFITCDLGAHSSTPSTHHEPAVVAGEVYRSHATGETHPRCVNSLAFSATSGSTADGLRASTPCSSARAVRRRRPTGPSVSSAYARTIS